MREMDAFWSRSFCLLTTGGVTTEVIRRYIESQGKSDEQGIQIQDKTE
jgi:REP element-mobilizing transposase RayT